MLLTEYCTPFFKLFCILLRTTTKYGSGDIDKAWDFFRTSTYSIIKSCLFSDYAILFRKARQMAKIWQTWRRSALNDEKSHNISFLKQELLLLFFLSNLHHIWSDATTKAILARKRFNDFIYDHNNNHQVVQYRKLRKKSLILSHDLMSMIQMDELIFSITKSPRKFNTWKIGWAILL